MDGSIGSLCPAVEGLVLHPYRRRRSFLLLPPPLRMRSLLQLQVRYIINR
jgi:hypothetical protein